MTHQDQAVAIIELAIRQAWAADTSYWPTYWSEENPALGQCAVTALIIQAHLGGDLRRGQIGRVSHYWNILSSGRVVDLTRDQFFTDHGPVWHDPIKVVMPERGQVLRAGTTGIRYHRLRERARL